MNMLIRKAAGFVAEQIILALAGAAIARITRPRTATPQVDEAAAPEGGATEGDE